MDYSQVTHRLRTIKKEIYDLSQNSITDIHEKIQNLKSINLLLREQNQLLLIRQELISARQNFRTISPNKRQIFSNEYQNEKVA